MCVCVFLHILQKEWLINDNVMCVSVCMNDNIDNQFM